MLDENHYLDLVERKRNTLERVGDWIVNGMQGEL
jgi:hypothetical protein